MDLSTPYLGRTLANPLVVSSSPITRDLDQVRRAEDAGAAAFVLHSLFEEQIEAETLDLDRYLDRGSESYAESLSYFPDMRSYNTGPEGYLEQLRRVKQAVGVPVVGSLNGTSPGGWVSFARLIEQAGADGLELNVYDIPTDATVDAGQVERSLLELVRAVRAEIRVPMAVKIGPFFTSPANLLLKLHEAGAQAAVLFNRFYQPDLDIEELSVGPHLVLSTSDELRLPMRWIAILYSRVQCSLALTTGVHTVEDAVKAVMAGADVANTTSALLHHGIDHITTLVDGFARWMDEHEYESVDQMKGSLSQRNVAEPAAFERANYMKTLQSYKNLA